jgi:amino acid transporter
MPSIPTPRVAPPLDHPTLQRTIGPVQLIFYGTGSMLGAGIYALIGRAAGLLGNAIWVAFLLSMAAALLTGLSYANLGSRYPRAAGAAYAAHRAYRRAWLTYLVGLAIVASGMASMATGSRAIGEELVRLGLPLPEWALALAFLFAVTFVVFWGIRESMALNILCTTIEAAGLLFVIAIGLRFWGNANLFEGPIRSDGTTAPLTTAIVLSGAVLTFFSFIGFEDILNVSEECRNPETTVPIGLVGSVLIATAIYMLVAITAVSVLPSGELARGNLRDVVARAAPWFPAVGFSFITIFAVANTALLNGVMGSRLLYGMGRGGLLPAAVGKVHPTRRTPHVAVAVILAMVTALMLSGQITHLASATVLLLLMVFSVVNVALVILKLKKDEPRGRFEVPIVVPLLGAGVCLTLLVSRLLARDKDGQLNLTAPAIAGALVLLILVLYVVLRPKRVVMEEA